ncbi:MAG: hypothetical protein Tsb0014_39660 [Pleurocapsa sp.]
MNSYQPHIDLAGEVCFRPNFWQTQRRINHLITSYLRDRALCRRLEDLPRQFVNPQPRPWQPIDWDQINAKEVIGIDVNVFVSIIKGALDTEAPIRGYTQTSRQYLAPIHPAMAKFVGGVVTPDGKMKELGLWEKEERQHTPALLKIYQQLTGCKIKPNLRTVKTYQPNINPYQDLYKHGLHRIATEYSAVCLYLWMMAHSTGTIQQVLAELLQDEINHLSKFWGVGMWLYPDGYVQLTKHILVLIQELLPLTSSENSLSRSNLVITFRRMMSILNWQSWTCLSKIELIYTFIWVLQRMWQWSRTLTPEYLQPLCATQDFFGHNNPELTNIL